MLKTSIYLLLSITLSCFSLYAQSEEQKIENNIAKLYKAMVEQDKKVMLQLTSEKLTYGHSSGTIENKTEYVEAVMNGSFDFFTLLAENQSTTISGDTAISRHIFVATGTNNGEKANVRIGVMMTWQKEDGKWILLGRQAYKL